LGKEGRGKLGGPLKIWGLTKEELKKGKRAGTPKRELFSLPGKTRSPSLREESKRLDNPEAE